jgi:DNA-binding phage protein
MSVMRATDSRAGRRKRRPAPRSFDELVEERFGPSITGEAVARGMVRDAVLTLCAEIRRRDMSLIEFALRTRMHPEEFARVFDEGSFPPLDLLQRAAHALGLRLDLRLVRACGAGAP